MRLSKSLIYSGHFLEHFETALFPLGVAISAISSGPTPTSSLFLVLSLTPLTKLVRFISSLFWLYYLKNHTSQEALKLSVCATGVISLCMAFVFFLPSPFYFLALYLLRLFHQGFSSIETPLAESLALRAEKNNLSVAGSHLNILTVLSHLAASFLLSLLVALSFEKFWPCLYALSGLFSFVLLTKRSRLARAEGKSPKQNSAPFEFSIFLKFFSIYFFGYFTFFFTTYYYTFNQLLCLPQSLLLSLNRNTTFLLFNLFCLLLSKGIIKGLPSIKKDPWPMSQATLLVWLGIAAVVCVRHFLFSNQTNCDGLHSRDGLHVFWNGLSFFLLVLSATLFSSIGPCLRHEIARKRIPDRTLCLSHTLASSLSSALPLALLLPHYLYSCFCHPSFQQGGFLNRASETGITGWIYALVLSALLLFTLREKKALVGKTSIPKG